MLYNNNTVVNYRPEKVKNYYIIMFTKVFWNTHDPQTYFSNLLTQTHAHTRVCIFIYNYCDINDIERLNNFSLIRKKD